eukprot:UN31740
MGRRTDRKSTEGHFRVLNLGSGPLTWFGNKLKCAKCSMELLATDRLAHTYDILMNKFNIEPKIPTQFAHPELLGTSIPTNIKFDMVVSINGLNHSGQPEEAIVSAVQVTKDGGTIRLKNKVNREGLEYTQMWGLHQWKFYIGNGMLIFFRPGEIRKLQHAIKHTCISERTDAKTSVIIITCNLQKTSASIVKLVIVQSQSTLSL